MDELIIENETDLVTWVSQKRYLLKDKISHRPIKEGYFFFLKQTATPIKVLFKDHDSYVDISLYGRNKLNGDYLKMVTFSVNTDLTITYKESAMQTSTYTDHMTEQIVNLYFGLMAYMNDITSHKSDYYGKELPIQHKVIDKYEVRKNKKGKRGTRMVKVKYNQYKISVPSDLKRDYVRQAESWSVRGHFRQYKNGKQVWIKPYNKGQGKLEDKKYLIKK